MSDTVHIPVLLEESMLVLKVKPGGVYVDGTLGGGSHTEALLKRSAPNGCVLSLDVNPKALEAAGQRLANYGTRWKGKDGNFRYMADLAQEEAINAVDGILLDLGFSSDELLDPMKGISFQQDGILDMRLGPASNDDGLTASDIVNSWPKGEIETMIREFGEERFARRIAEGIVDARKVASISRVLDLVAVIKRSVPGNYEQGRIHPATRTFQALRIAVNDEVQALKQAIEQAHRLLAPGGTLAIITFHSIEDRIVKLAFQQEDKWEPVSKKPLLPTEHELARNPRSRSAKLRAAHKK